MNATVQKVLESFDALSEADKHRVAVEILRRVSADAVGDIPESVLVEAADELFRALDAEEANHAPRGEALAESLTHQFLLRSKSTTQQPR
jgi:hypothetical protein